VRPPVLTLLAVVAVACGGPTPDGTTVVLSANPAHLDLGSSPRGAFDVQATGTWTATHTAAWLEITPTAGYGPARIEVTAHREGLTPDTRTAEVTITSGNRQAGVLITSRFPTIHLDATWSSTFAGLPAAHPIAGATSGDGDEHHANELVVTLHPPDGDRTPASGEQALAALAREHGVTVLRAVYTDDRTVATLRTGGGAAQAAQRLRADPRVRTIWPGVRVEILASDPLANQQAWHYGQVNLVEAWGTTTGSATVTVAVIDTGFDMLHEDLVANLEAGYDFGGQDADPHAVTAACGDHGTHVAGTVGAPRNGVGGTGIAPVVTIAPLKVGTYNAGTGACEIWSPALLDAIYHAAGANVAGTALRDAPVDVINISLGLGTYYAPLHDAVRFAAGAGVTIVAASGNAGERAVLFPAAHAEVIAVGATNAKSERASYSNYGTELDLLAPGGEGRFASVVSTLWSDTHDAYGGMQGTSMAAPHVSGVVALLKSVNPGLGPSTIQRLLRSTARDIGDPGWDELTGYGIVDAEAAVLAARAQGSEDGGLAFRLYVLHDDGSRTLAAETLGASTLQHHQAGFGTYVAEVGGDADADGVLGELGEWFGTAMFDVSPHDGDHSVTVILTLQ
jgi:hypothetical protein